MPKPTSSVIVTPTAPATYTLECIGPGGAAIAAAELDREGLIGRSVDDQLEPAQAARVRATIDQALRSGQATAAAEDLAWVCLPPWRFGQITQPVAGLGRHRIDADGTNALAVE